MMFERILLAVDGSDHSKRAVSLAGEIASKFNAKVTIVHVREIPVTWALDFDPGLIERSDASTAALMDDVVRTLEDEGVPATADVREAPAGGVAHEIIAAAQAIEASAIVMGTRGLSDWKGLLLGSVAHKVVHLAPCPVLVVR